MKIYCNDCDNLTLYPDKEYGIRYICKVADNKNVTKETWFIKKEYIRNRYPEEINQNNDCIWYKVSEKKGK